MWRRHPSCACKCTSHRIQGVPSVTKNAAGTTMRRLVTSSRHPLCMEFFFTNSCLWENLAPQHSIMVRFFSVNQFFGTPCKHGDTENCCERWRPPAPPNAAGIPPVPGTFFIRLLVAISSPLFSAKKTTIVSIIIINMILIFILFPVTISRGIIIITTICLSPSLSSANNWTRPNMLQTPKTTVGGQADAEDQGILVVFVFYQVVHCLGIFHV